MALQEGRSKATVSNQSTEKALVIMEYLAGCQQPVRLNEISGALGQNASTTLRFLTSLQGCGYVTQDSSSSKYSLTYKLCRLANQFSRNAQLQTITHPYLIQLTNLFQESACVSVEQDMTMVYVDVMSGPGNTLMSMQRVGNTSPMHSTGNGKLLLLNYTDEQIDLLISKRGLKRYTDKTITDKQSLLARLEAIRLQGYAYDDEECEIGLRCLAYPIYDYTGRIVAGISITGPSSRMTDEMLTKHQCHLQQSAHDISLQLGYID